MVLRIFGIPIFANAIFEILLGLVVCLVLIAIGSIFVIRDLKLEFKKVYKIRSRFHIEMRKICNLMYKIHGSDILEPFTKVVIKEISHAEKSILLKNIDLVYEGLNLEAEDNKYIIETYENLQNLRRERDAKILCYNHKIKTFPFSIYARVMKMKSYVLYTENKRI